MVLSTMAPAPAPESEKPTAALTDTATPVPVEEIELSPNAMSVTSLPASTSLSLMRARTVPSSELEASAKARDRAIDAPAAKAPLTATPTTLLVIDVSSLASRITEPRVASTSESALISASVRLVEFTVASAPAADAEAAIPPAPPRPRATPTPRTSTVPVESAVSLTSPVDAVTSEPEIVARAVVPKFTSDSDKASARFSAAPPPPLTLSEAATSFESIADWSVALSVTENASTTEPPVIPASTRLVRVFSAIAAAPLSAIATPPPADTATAAATPSASMVLLARASTRTAPVVSTSELTMRA